MKRIFCLSIITVLMFIMSLTVFAADSTSTDARPNIDFNSGADYTDSGNRKVTLYNLILEYDVNGDGKTSIADAKKVLQHVADIIVLDEDAFVRADADENGKISIADAKIILQTVAGLRNVYVYENGDIVTGFFTTADGKTVYLDKNGMKVKGVVEIGGKMYLFSQDGVMLKTGIQTYAGNKYLVLDDNTVALNGFHKYNGKTYLSDSNGVLLKGRRTVNGKTYLLDDSYALVINSSAKDNGVLYYTDANGVLLNGVVTRKDGKYLYENGRPFNGWKYPGLDMFYYDKNGKLAVNTKIGYFTFDANGNPSATEINHDTLKYHLRKILKQHGSSPRNIFDYVSNHDIFSYKVMNKGASAEEMVIYMLKYHKGSCYQFAYFTQALYREAGYECEVVIGTVISNASGTKGQRTTHYWNKVKFPDGWFYVDTEYPWSQNGVYKKTEAQMKELSYRW